MTLQSGEGTVTSTPRWAWCLFGMLLALFVLALLAETWMPAFEGTLTGNLLRLLFPNPWSRNALVASAGTAAPALFGLAALLVLTGILRPTSGPALIRWPEAPPSWPRIVIALVLAEGGWSILTDSIGLVRFSTRADMPLFVRVHSAVDLLIGLGGAVAGWLLLFRKEQTARRRWAGWFAAAAVTLFLAFIGWSMVRLSLPDMSSASRSLLPTQIFVCAATLWAGLALARGASFAVDFPPESAKAATAHLLLAALLVTVCFEQAAYSLFPGFGPVGFKWAAVPFLLAVGYLALIQLMNALSGAVEGAQSTIGAQPPAGRLTRAMVVWLVIVALLPPVPLVIIFLFLAFLFRGAQFN